MQETKNWYAVYTRPKWEKKVSELLTRKQIENYCPLNKVVRQWHDRKKTLMEPLFKSYVFVRTAEQELWHTKTVDGVLSVVHWLRKPAVIRPGEIDAIKFFLNEYESIQLEKTVMNINDTVRVVNGPLGSLEGNVIEVKNRTVKVLLPSLGYHIIAEVTKENIEKVVEISTSYSHSQLLKVS